MPLYFAAPQRSAWYENPHTFGQQQAGHLVQCVYGGHLPDEVVDVAGDRIGV